MVQFSIEELLCKYGINIWRLKESLNKKSFFSCNLVFQDIILSLSFANKGAVDNFISILIYFVVRMVINFLALSMTRRCLSNQGFLWCLYTYWHILITVINRLYPGKDCPFSLSLYLVCCGKPEWSVMTSACSFGNAFPPEMTEMGTQGDCNRNPGPGSKRCMNGVWLIRACGWYLSYFKYLW